MMKATPARRERAFTLVELLIVVIILGVLAAIVVPNFADAGSTTEQTVFVADLRTFVTAAKYYLHKTGEHLPDSVSGQLPAGFAGYIDADKWTRVTPIGGVWDTELDSFGVKSALGVHFQAGQGTSRGDPYMLEVDEILDDGNLATGGFRKLAADRYYYVLAGN